MAWNPRITKKEMGLIKGALRRVFSRSDMRKAALEASLIYGHIDYDRPRVKKWSVCARCNKASPTYLCEVNHTPPVVPTNKTLEDMDPTELVDNIWCDISRLTTLCKPCHREITKAENKLRPKRRKK